MALARYWQKQFMELITSMYRDVSTTRKYMGVCMPSLLYEKTGVLDDQFIQLQKLQDESNPDFVVEIVSLFFEDSEKLLNNLAIALHQHVVDFKQVDAHVHQFKGSSSSIGAKKVRNGCAFFRNYCDESNLQGCLNCLQLIKYEYSVVKGKLENLLWLEQQILAAGGTIPVMP